MKKRTSGASRSKIKCKSRGRGPNDYTKVGSFKALVADPKGATRLEGIEWDTVVADMQKIAKKRPEEVHLLYDPNSNTVYHHPQKAVVDTRKRGQRIGGVGVELMGTINKSRFPKSLIELHTHPRGLVKTVTLLQLEAMKNDPNARYYGPLKAIALAALVQFMHAQLPSDEDLEVCRPGYANAIVSESGVVFYGVTRQVKGLSASKADVKLALQPIGTDWWGRFTFGRDTHGGVPFGFDFDTVLTDIKSEFACVSQASMSPTQRRNKVERKKVLELNPDGNKKDIHRTIDTLLDTIADRVRRAPLGFRAYRFALDKVARAYPRFGYLPGAVVVAGDIDSFEQAMQARRTKGREQRESLFPSVWNSAAVSLIGLGVGVLLSAFSESDV